MMRHKIYNFIIIENIIITYQLHKHTTRKYHILIYKLLLQLYYNTTKQLL